MLIKTLHVILTRTRHSLPLATILNMQDIGSDLTPGQMRALAAAFSTAADDCEAQPMDPKHFMQKRRSYTLQEPEKKPIEPSSEEKTARKASARSKSAPEKKATKAGESAPAAKTAEKKATTEKKTSASPKSAPAAAKKTTTRRRVSRKAAPVTPEATNIVEDAASETASEGAEVE
ncbi:MAG: hypothetical protein WC291_12815 [Thermodesulfovibrionales bacterium]